MKKFFLFLFVGSLVLTHTYSQSLNFEKAQSDSIYFPLDMGNKFFYKGGREPDDGFYGATKEITDTFANGTRVVTVTNYYIDFTNSTTEYWFFSDNKFYADSYYPSLLDYPVFNGYFTEDTCVYGISKCYYIFYGSIFNQNLFCQAYVDRYSGMTSFKTISTYSANGIGVYFKLIGIASMGYSSKDSIQLIGYLNNGILIGDSIITDIYDPNPINYSYYLNQNYPNPFNPTTTISYQLAESGFVTVKVYDILGREVATLVNEEKPAGSYEVQFEGSGLTSGIYFYKLKAGSFVKTKKMILLK